MGVLARLMNLPLMDDWLPLMNFGNLGVYETLINYSLLGV